MAYAFVQDVAASWGHYEQVAAALIEPTPRGLILHVAGPTDEGFRIIAIWESEADSRRFRRERLAPAIASLGTRREPTFRELRPSHVVVGAQDNAGSLEAHKKEEKEQ